MKQDICMETVHGRKSKSQTSFKAVLNKVLVSALILGTVAGMGTPAFAAEVGTPVGREAQTIAYNQGISVESAIVSLRNTISTIKGMIESGNVSSDTLRTLATQLYNLETTVKTSGEGVTNDVIAILDEAERVVNSMGKSANVTDTANAYAAIVAVRNNLSTLKLGNTTVTATNKAAAKVLGFSDVKSTDWFYKAVNACRERGAISGTTSPDADGKASFSPNSPVTRAQFIKMAVGVCLGDNAPAQDPTIWWLNSYNYALENDVIDSNFYPNTEEAMSKAITRYEMAEIINNCCDIILKEGNPDEGLARQLADYGDVSSTRFKTDVSRTYARGIIQGGSGGYFNGSDGGTRAHAAQMLATMMNYIDRANPANKPIFNEQDGSTTPAPTARILRWDDPTRPYAREGDTFVAKDGKEYKLTLDPKTGIIGYGLPIATDLGRTDKGETVKDGGYVTTLSRPEISGNQYLVNSKNGEGHFNEAWGAISREYTPTYQGKVDGELSADKNFIWSDILGGWTLTVLQNR